MFIILSVGVLLLAFVPMYSFFNVSFKENNVPIGSFKIMTYNVHNFDAYEWWRNYESRSKFYRLFKEEKVDVICFQEFFSLKSPEGFNYIDSLREVFGYTHHYFHVMEQQENQQYHGISIFSKHPILNSGKIDYYAATKNGTVFADINYNGKIIRVFNSHFESIRLPLEDKNAIKSFALNENRIHSILTKFKDASQRRKQQVEHVVNAMNECPYPIISCGDFNEVPLSSAYNNIVGTRGLQDTFLEKGFGLGGTFISVFPWLRIDHILVDPSIEILTHEVLEHTYSDHYPIISYLSL